MPSSPRGLSGTLWPRLPDTVSWDLTWLTARTDSLPVHYVFPRQSLDVDHALESLQDASKPDREERRGVVVVWDVAYDWKAGEPDQHCG